MNTETLFNIIIALINKIPVETLYRLMLHIRGQLLNMEFSFEINYDLTPAELDKGGKYSGKGWLEMKKLSDKCGAHRVRTKIFSLMDRSYTENEIRELMKSQGYAPANLYELLAFDHAHPHEIWHHVSITAIGIRYHSSDPMSGPGSRYPKLHVSYGSPRLDTEYGYSKNNDYRVPPGYYMGIKE